MLRFCFVLITSFLCSPVTAQQHDFVFSDLHNSALYRIVQLDDYFSFADTSFPTNITTLQQLNSQLIFLSIGIPKYGSKGPQQTSIEDVLSLFRGFKKHCSLHYPQVAFVKNKTELDKALKANQIALAFALEGSYLLEGKINYIDSLYQEGLAMVGIAHWFCNDFIINPKDKKTQELGFAKISEHSKLSNQGKKLLKKLISLGVFIDVAHMRGKLFRQVVHLNSNRSKLVSSHANSFHIYNHPRNLSDKELLSIAKTGGLIGVCFHKPIIAAENANLDAFVQHIKHIVSVVGVNHVCIGTDLEGNIFPVLELSQLKSLYSKLLAEGFNKDETNKILGTNILSIWE